MISYIEENTLGDGDSRKKTNAQTDKAKVLRDTKFIPKLILRIENFDKFVICLGKKTKLDLSKHLHIGTVRDFRIKSSQLKEAINEALSKSQVMDIDEMSGEDEYEEGCEPSPMIDDDDEDEGEPRSSPASTSSTARTTPSIEQVIDDVEEICTTSVSGAIRNLQQINQKANKRKKREPEASESTADQGKKRKANTGMKINKRALDK